MTSSLGGEPETAAEERAISARLISVNWIPWSEDKFMNEKGRRHATVALQSVLADLDSILAVFFGDAARTTHRSRLLWLGFGGCGTRHQAE